MTTSHRDKPAGYSSVFDESLRRNRERMNEKMQGFSRQREDSPGSPPAVPRYTPAPTPREGSTFPRNASPPITGSSAAPFTPPASTPPTQGGTRSAALPAQGEGARLLTARFGDKWRHEITERRQESGEAIVVCRVSVPEEGLSQTHTGRARIPGSTRPVSGKEARSIQGSADGIPFTFRTDSGSTGGIGNGGSGGATGETEERLEAAFQAALEEAMLECARSFRTL